MPLLEHHEIDKKKWDECIAHSPQGLIYALSWYLDAVSPGWQAIVEETDGRYVAVMPLPAERKLGVNYLRQPLFCQQLGLFSVKEEMNEALQERFLRQVFNAYSYIINYQFNITNKLLTLFPADVKQVQHFTHQLDLSTNYPVILKNFSTNCKRNLDRARKANLSVEESADLKPLIDLFRTHTAQKIEGGVSEAAYLILQNLHEQLHQRGLCRLLYAKNATGKIMAGALFPIYKEQIVYLFNAASEEGRKMNAITLLINQMIGEYAGKDYVLDFESPGSERIGRFYGSFGASPVPFETISYNRLPLWINWLKKMKYVLYKKILKL